MGFVNSRQPSNQAIFDTRNSSTGASALNYKLLIIGQGTDAGSASANTLTLLSSDGDAASKFGEGSMVHRQAKRVYANSNSVEVWAIAPTMDALAVATSKAVGEIKFTGAATASGTLAVYIAGERVSLAVTAGDTVADLADNLAAAIATQVTDLPVKSTSDTTDTVDFEALNLGTLGNDIDIQTNAREGEVDPAGVAYTIIAMNAGAADPALTSLIAAMGDEWFQVIAFAYNDSTNIPAIQTELDRRNGATLKIDGLAFLGKKGTYAQLVTFGLLYNTEQVSAIGANGMMMTPYEFSAGIAGAVANHLQAGNGNEALPFQTTEIVGADAPPIASQFTFTEQGSLLQNGISTFNIDAGSKVRIARLITMYRLNAGGVPDVAWLDVNTRFTAMYIRYDWVRRIGLRYPQAKLADDGNRIGPGQVVMTPSVGRAEAIQAFLDWEVIGLVEDYANFKDSLLAYRDLSDVNKFNWELFPDFVNQLRSSNTKINIIL